MRVIIVIAGHVDGRRKRWEQEAAREKELDSVSYGGLEVGNRGERIEDYAIELEILVVELRGEKERGHCSSREREKKRLETTSGQELD